MTKHAPKPGDIDYNPAKDDLFQDRLQDAIDEERDNIDKPKASTLPVPKESYAGTGKTAAELVALYGTNPDGSPRTQPVPDGPTCPPVSPDGYPFDTTAIPQGLNEPLSQECADHYNRLYAPTTASVGTFAKK